MSFRLLYFLLLILEPLQMFFAFGQKPSLGFTRHLGLHHRPTEADNFVPPHVQFYASDAIIVHSNFTPRLDYDVCLIKIGTKYVQHSNGSLVATNTSGWINYTDAIRPVCLPCMEGNCLEKYLRRRGHLRGNENDEERCSIEMNEIRKLGIDNALVFSVGFGQTEPLPQEEQRSAQLKHRLQQKLLMLHDDNYCNDFASNRIPWPSGAAEAFYTDRMMCASSGIPGILVDNCFGDGGGSVVREFSFVDGDGESKCWVQIGIVSWGWGCGQTVTINGAQIQIPGYLSNVASMMDWIRITMEDQN